MIETTQRHAKETAETLSPIQPSQTEPITGTHRQAGPKLSPGHGARFYRQAPRFILVGGLNTAIDLLALNGLLLFFPTNNTWLILLYTVFAFGIGATNSFLLNKYWTFEHRQPTTPRELTRFSITTLFGISWNATLIWLASSVPHPFLTNTVIWTNASKLLAIGSAALFSYLGMRLWVFVNPPQRGSSPMMLFTTQNRSCHPERSARSDCAR